MKRNDRFKDLIWAKHEGLDCLLGGAGGIGSWLAFLLSRATFNVVIYDFDTVDYLNLGGQLFSDKHLNMSKADAVKQIVADFSGKNITVFNQRYTEDSIYNNFMFSCFDNMEARKIMFNNWKKAVEDWKEDTKVAESVAKSEDIEEVTLPFTPLFIDGRLGAEHLEIFCVTPDKIEEYEKNLFDDSEIPDEPCTMKQTSHSAAMIASLMVGFFTNHISNLLDKESDREVPFSFRLHIPMCIINFE